VGAGAARGGRGGLFDLVAIGGDERIGRLVSEGAGDMETLLGFTCLDE
jgi:hypothetical protein